MSGVSRGMEKAAMPESVAAETGKAEIRTLFLDIANSKECKHQSQYNQRNCICRYRGHEIINNIEAAKCSDSI